MKQISPADAGEEVSSLMQRFRDSTVGLVPELRGEDPPTFKCGLCLDTLFVLRDCGGHHRSRLRRGKTIACTSGGCMAAWFCSCDDAESAEAGYWFDVTFPMQGHRRAKSDHGEGEFLEYLRSNPTRNFRLRAAVETLRQKYEKARSRKLDDVREDD